MQVPIIRNHPGCVGVPLAILFVLRGGGIGEKCACPQDGGVKGRMQSKLHLMKMSGNSPLQSTHCMGATHGLGLGPWGEDPGFCCIKAQAYTYRQKVYCVYQM